VPKLVSLILKIIKRILSGKKIYLACVWKKIHGENLHLNINYDAFDVLKNKWLDKITLAVLCLILKLFMVLVLLDKLEAKGQDKN
jgi:hypothetical protein